MHCQNADWATPFLLHKFNITAQDSLVGTDFGKYAKYKRPERRGGKTFLSGKSWKTTYVHVLDHILDDVSSLVISLSHKTCFGSKRTFLLLRSFFEFHSLSQLSNTDLKKT